MFRSLEPHDLALDTTGASLGKWLFEGLTRLNLNGEYALAGAEKLDISPCQTRYIFTLRSNYYSDGTLVTAHDYERCWKKAIAPDSKGRGHHFSQFRLPKQRNKKFAPLQKKSRTMREKGRLICRWPSLEFYFNTRLNIRRRGIFCFTDCLRCIYTALNKQPYTNSLCPRNGKTKNSNACSHGSKPNSSFRMVFLLFFFSSIISH